MTSVLVYILTYQLSTVRTQTLKKKIKLHKITHNSIRNNGSTLILTNLEGVHQNNIHTKCEVNLCIGLRGEGEKVKKLPKTTTTDTG